MHWIGERLCPHFPIQPLWGSTNHDKKDVDDNRKSLMVAKTPVESSKVPKIAWMPPCGQRKNHEK